jgi:hypothetical protein
MVLDNLLGGALNNIGMLWLHRQVRLIDQRRMLRLTPYSLKECAHRLWILGIKPCLNDSATLDFVQRELSALHRLAPKCARPAHERNNVPVRRQHTFEPQSCRATCQFASPIKNVPEDGLRSAKVTTVGRRIRIVPHDVRAENGLDCRPIPPGSRLIQHLYEAHVGMLALPFCTAHFSNLSNARHRAASELWRKAT